MPRPVDLLPRSIQELSLGDCDFNEIEHHLVELLARREEVPALKKVYAKVRASYILEEEEASGEEDGEPSLDCIVEE
jgi:hypothetical protein